MTTTWTPVLPRSFARIPTNPREWECYPPYHRLLGTLFPPDSPFTVVWRTPNKRTGLDFFEVRWGNAPVFVLTIKAGPTLSLASAREEADTKIRTKLTELINACPLRTLHGVSAIGTRLCFYTAQEGHAITPLEISANDDTTDVAPVERWDCDLSEPEGAARFKAVIYEIHQACAWQLNTWCVDWYLRRSITHMLPED